MIYTVTFNPSLDYVIQSKALVPGKINRSEKENIYPGGKGNNVSVVLANLGIESHALGFKAGFTGDHMEKMLKSYGIYTDFITLQEGCTRINVKIHAEKETEINGQGPKITEEALDQLFQKLDCLKTEDYLVLAGSIPHTLPEDIYMQIMERLQGKGIHFIVDATKNLLLNVLKYHPFLIKPNHHELSEIFGRELQTKEEIIEHAKKLQEMGAEHVLASMAGDGAILLTADGRIYQASAPQRNVVNSVGAGDSMVAGFLAGYLNSGDLKNALRLGIASGSATTFCSWLATKEEITSLLTTL